MKKVVIILFCFIAITTFGQTYTNYIKNGNFEDDSGNPTAPGQIEKLDHWESRKKVYDEDGDGEVDLWFHSPDYHKNGVSFSNGISSAPGGSYNGENYVAMGTYELLQQEHNANALEQGKHYTISMQIQLGDAFPSEWSGTTGRFKILLAKQKIKYKGDNVSDRCLQDYVDYQNQLGQDIWTIGTFDLNINTYPVGSGWHRISASFIAPVDIQNYDWFAIDIEQLDYNTNWSLPNSDCTGDYLWVDDIRMERSEFCQSPCAANLGPINHGTIPNAMISNGTPGYFSIIIENAIGIKFTVFNKWGQQIWEQHAFDPNGLKDVGYTDYQLFWYGEDINGNVFQQDVYVYNLDMWNCDYTTSYLGESLTYINGAGNYIQPPDIVNYELDDCCKEYAYYQDVQIFGTHRENVHDFITAGSNVTAPPFGPVGIMPGADVVWRAGNEINLLPGFQTLVFTSFTALVTDCLYGEIKASEMSRLQDKKLFNDQELSLNSELREVFDFNLYPNPSSSGVFNIELNKNVQEPIKIVVTNVLSQVLYTSTQYSDRFQVILEATPGFYVIQLQIGNEILTKQLIIE